MNKKSFSVKSRILSFTHAIRGLGMVIRTEHNMWIHFAIATLAIAAAYYFKASPLEWIAILFAIGLVMMSEILNTVVEKIADFISPAYDSKIKDIKDMAAGAVLISAMIAVVVGLIVFGPKIL